MTRLVLALAALSFLVIACKPATDLNKPCRLVKAGADNKAVNLTEGEVRAAQGANKDFISNGSIDCEDLICVRDSYYPLEADFDAGATAYGYCSKQCQQGTTCDSFDSDLDRGPKAMSCRALFLSQETLALLGDAGFPGIRDPYFCARGQAQADAGTN